MMDDNFLEMLYMLICRSFKLDERDSDWLRKELYFILNKYPRLTDFIIQRLRTCALEKTLKIFFNKIAKIKSIDQYEFRGKLKDIYGDELQNIRLFEYLIADISLKQALNHCFNHRYNDKQKIAWNIDYTSVYQELLEDKMTLCKDENEAKGASSIRKLTPR